MVPPENEYKIENMPSSKDHFEALHIRIAKTIMMGTATKHHQKDFERRFSL